MLLRGEIRFQHHVTDFLKHKFLILTIQHVYCTLFLLLCVTVKYYV